MKLVLTENITLDGVVEATGGWFAPAGDEADVDSTPTSKACSRLRWHSRTVCSSGEPPPAPCTIRGVENTTVLRGPVAEEVQALKDTAGGDLGVTGASPSPTPSSRHASWRSTGSSPTPLCWVTAGGCSPTAPPPSCPWSRRHRSAPVSSCSPTARTDLQP